MARILVGTDDGLRTVGASGQDRTPTAHEGRAVTALTRDGSELWAILDGHEVWHTVGMEGWFHAVDLDGLRGNCLAATGTGVLVGTTEAHLLRVAGDGLEPVGSFENVEGRRGWYTPWGGPPDTRSISEDDEAVYVNVHVGGIVRSRDKGDSWEPTIDVDADVHDVWASDGRVFAACAGGLASSIDRGDRWAMRTEGLQATYCRAVTVFGDTVLVSASSGPRGGNAALYRGSLDPGALERCRQGLPESFDRNIDSAWLDATPSLAAFATADGRVFSSTDEGASWADAASGLSGVGCVLVMP